MNVSNIESEQDYFERVKAASFIATLQAGYTDFHYLRDTWREQTEKDSLIGVSMTGIASGKVLQCDMQKAAEIVKQENARVANRIGINKASRTTCVKPSGTSSLVLGSSSGIHAWHAPHYLRRVRVMKDESIYIYLKNKLPEFIEDDFFNPINQAVITLPMKAPKGSIYRTESAIDLLERVKSVYENWVVPGHRKGDNYNNISCTVSVKDDEWKQVGDWMWKNRNSYNGLSVLPFDDSDYVQMPLEECTKYIYDKMFSQLSQIDLSEIKEEEDNTSLKEQVACARWCM